MKVNSINAKSIICKSKIYGIKYSFNPYIGCSHDCKYCFAEYMKKYTKHDFDEWGTFVDYKENTIEILTKELEKKEYKETIMLGTVTDCYQHIEHKLKITREALKLFLKHNCKISILTKSNLILRDLDLLKQFNDIEVGISCSLVNEKDRVILEPNTPSIKDRMETLKILKENGIRTFLFIAPFIPHISNLDASMRIFSKYVDYILLDSLNFKGPNKSKIIDSLDKVDINKRKKIISLIGNEKYYSDLDIYFKELCNKYNVKGYTVFF